MLRAPDQVINSLAFSIVLHGIFYSYSTFIVHCAFSNEFYRRKLYRIVVEGFDFSSNIVIGGFHAELMKFLPQTCFPYTSKSKMT